MNAVASSCLRTGARKKVTCSFDPVSFVCKMEVLPTSGLTVQK